MNDMRPITIRLTLDGRERVALERAAAVDLRRPRDQARMILRKALGLTNDETTGTEFGDLGPVVSETQSIASL